MRYCPKCGQRVDAAQSRCSRCLNELFPSTGTVRGVGFNLGEPQTPAKFTHSKRSGRRDATLTGFGIEVEERWAGADARVGNIGQNAIVPAPVVNVQEASSAPSQRPAVRISRPPSVQTVDIGIIISTGEVEGHDTTVEIDATATLHGTAPPQKGAEQRRGITGTLQGAAALLDRPRGDVFALNAPVRSTEAVQLPEGTEVLSPSIAPAVQYAQARAASRLAVARVSMDNEEAPSSQYRPRQSSDIRAMDVSALFYRIDAEMLGQASTVAASPSSNHVGEVPLSVKSWRWKALRLRSPVAFYSVLTTLFVFLVWGCVRLAVKQ